MNISRPALPWAFAALSLLMAGGAGAIPYVNFESPQVHPIALTPDGTRLLVVNTPDNRLAVYDVSGSGLTLAFEVPVGLEPVSVAAESNGRAWVANHISDTVSVTANTEALNHIRFEPNQRGQFVRTRISIVDPASPATRSIVDLNPHIDYNTTPGPQSEIDFSLSQPGAMAFRSTGGVAYVAALGSAKVGVLNDNGAVVDRIAVGHRTRPTPPNPGGRDDGVATRRTPGPSLVGCGPESGHCDGASGHRTNTRRHHLQIAKTSPKTPKSRRLVPIPGVTMDGLKHHKVEQARHRLQLGEGYKTLDLVFAAPDGGPWNPLSFTVAFMELVRRPGMTRVRFHDLRHTHATQMLALGIHPKIASERLGHSTVGLTLDMYSHVLPSMQDELVEKIDRLMRETVGQD